MSSHHHPLPVGAELIGPNRTRFRLWAPAAGRVEVVLDGGDSIAMQSERNGYHAIEAACAAGSCYRYRIDGDRCVPDPASRLQADDVHGCSVVVDPRAYAWKQRGWRGREWPELAIQELHAGCLGGFDGVRAQLPRLAELGISAVELMPIADFPGQRNWGYDGVLPFAPDTSYGTPDQLKALVDHAHELGLCIYLDVVYNHFGPDGNYLHLYAPRFFDAGVQSPWGAAIDFKRREVRDFFTQNALYWLIEYRFDGLRFDAVHAIGEPDWLDEMAAAVRAAIEPGRHVHLVLENEHNTVSHLEGDFDAQWNDDGHNALHALLTGEREGYYANYWPRPVEHLARVLGEGFAYQGEVPPTRDGAPRGEPSAHLAPYRFVLFLQNHDQVGNRACGERLISLIDEDSLRAAVVLQLMCPQVPLLFMGEEWGSRQPFLFFTDFHDELGDAVREGRRREFAAFAAFADARARVGIPDPNDVETFLRSVPDLSLIRAGQGWAAFYRSLLRLRREYLQPRVREFVSGGVEVLGERALLARWVFGSGGVLCVGLNLGDGSVGLREMVGDVLVGSREGAGEAAGSGELMGNSCVVFWRGEV
jgi:maltooligosyltrehalose trehalohydrolase